MKMKLRLGKELAKHLQMGNQLYFGKLKVKKHHVRQAKMKLNNVLGKLKMHKDLGLKAKMHHVLGKHLVKANLGQQCILAKDLGLKAKMHHVLGKHLVKANLGLNVQLMQASGTIIHHVCLPNMHKDLGLKVK